MGFYPKKKKIRIREEVVVLPVTVKFSKKKLEKFLIWLCSEKGRKMIGHRGK